jgi:hypothetical protein
LDEQKNHEGTVDETAEENQNLLSFLQETHPACGIAGEKAFRPFAQLGPTAVCPYHQRLRKSAEVRATEILQKHEKSQSPPEMFRMRKVTSPPGFQEQRGKI